MSKQAPTKTKPKPKAKLRPKGVRYERDNGVIYVSLSTAMKLEAQGAARRDDTRDKYAICQRFRQSALGNAKHHRLEKWDGRQVYALIDPDTRQTVCGAVTRRAEVSR